MHEFRVELEVPNKENEMNRSVKCVILASIFILGLIAVDAAHEHFYRKQTTATVIDKNFYALGSLGNIHQVQTDDGRHYTIRDFEVSYKVIAGSNCDLMLSRNGYVVDATCTHPDKEKAPFGAFDFLQ